MHFCNECCFSVSAQCIATASRTGELHPPTILASNNLWCIFHDVLCIWSYLLLAFPKFNNKNEFRTNLNTHSILTNRNIWLISHEISCRNTFSFSFRDRNFRHTLSALTLSQPYAHHASGHSDIHIYTDTKVTVHQALEFLLLLQIFISITSWSFERIS